MTKEVEKWWNAASKGYQKDSNINTKNIHYGPFASNENKLRLLGKIKGKKILDIGCGGGQCSIVFAKQGAKCIGLDASKEQLKYAEYLAIKNKVSVKFIKHDIQTLKGFKSNTYDIVFSAYALQYVPDLIRCFIEISRVLKKNGLFVFSFGHPFFDSLSTKTMKIENNYNKSGKYVKIEIWPDNKKHKFVMYTRKISDICNSLVKAGLFLERIIEPFDTKTEKAWRNGGWKKEYPMKLVKKISPTIIFKSRKI